MVVLRFTSKLDCLRFDETTIGEVASSSAQLKIRMQF
jgi:hypothetical protein